MTQRSSEEEMEHNERVAKGQKRNVSMSVTGGTENVERLSREQGYKPTRQIQGHVPGSSMPGE